MELNQLPDGYEGAQKRQIEFESPEAKLAYDAAGLVGLAQSKYGKENVTVRDAIDLASRDDDDTEGLRMAIARKIKEKPQAMVNPAAVEAPAPATELSPEQAWLDAFKSCFNAFPQLHQGVQWTDVEKSLKADPEAIRKLKVLDEAGFEMNVFRSKNNGEIQFRTAQTDVTQIAAEYRTIMYDQQAQTDHPQYRANGNAVDLAASLGVELADKELYGQFRVQNGWVWLKTDDATRKTGYAFDGDSIGIRGNGASNRDVYGSFCAALRVKKLSL